MGRKAYPKKKCEVWFCPEDRMGGKRFCIRHNRQFLRSGGTNPVAGTDANLLLDIVVRSYTAMRVLTERCEKTCPFCGEHFNNHLPDCPMKAVLELLAERT